MEENHIGQIPELIELYLETRDSRLALEKQAEERKRLENSTKEKIEYILRLNGLTVGGGARYKATIEKDEKPTVTDWGKLYKHIMETGEFDLLQRRLLDSGVKARWEENKTIPGIVKFPVTKLSITKV
jgi:hypothetical protein